MWLSLSKGFLSVVTNRNDHDQVLVRSRVKSHITNYFPDHEISEIPGDYAYRIFITKEELKNFLIEYIDEMNYDNFKNSVPDDIEFSTLYDFYERTWMNGLKL